MDYRSRLEASRANLELQRANLRQAERELKRAKALFDQDAGSADRYDKAVSTREIAAAQVKLADEQLRQAGLNLGYTTIVAPSGGYVTRKSVQIGNQVQVGQPLMAIVELEDIHIVANYKETELARIRPGQNVRIKVDAYPGRSIQRYGGQHHGRHRRFLFALPCGERDRQLCESGPADPGQDRS